MQHILAVMQQNAVVHVSDIGFDSELLFHQTIERIQIKQGKALAGLIPPWESLSREIPRNCQ